MGERKGYIEKISGTVVIARGIKDASCICWI